MDKDTAVRLMESREVMYRFLGNLYLMEVDEEQLTALKNMSFPEISGDQDADMDLKEGYRLIRSWLDQAEYRDLDDLAADFARVFLAAGDAAGHAAFPYESVYVDKRRQVGGSTAMQMKALYLERGYEPDPTMFRTMDDNIGLILEYMGILCEELVSSLNKSDTEKAESLWNEQKQFLKKHITNWIFTFTSDVIKFAQRDFYRGLAMITNGFIKKETALLKGGKVWDTV